MYLAIRIRPVSQGREPTNASNPQQTCTQDLHAVLRQMSASLAEQSVEFTFKTMTFPPPPLSLSVKQVAFSASLLASGSGYVGPFNTDTPLRFTHVVTNIGSAYNPNTGFFIAPLRGAYHFEFYIGAHGDASHATCAVLVKNGEQVFMAWEQQPSYYGSSSNGVTLLLAVGEVVFLRLCVNTRIYDNENHLSTFSGHLLFTM
uniref:C1q domain-containing protein n=1 Tax=Labrus bergylta TaxID=56723 RepID=A0A3Q3MYA8_9LABR